MYTLVRKHVCATGCESVCFINQRHVWKAQSSRKKVNALASLFTTLKITPQPERTIQFQIPGAFEAAAHTKSQRAVSRETENQFALRRGGEATTKQRDAGTLSQSSLGAHRAVLARGGRGRGVLFTSSAPRERGPGVRARARTHTHAHTYTPGSMCQNPSRDPASRSYSARGENRCVPGVSPRP